MSDDLEARLRDGDDLHSRIEAADTLARYQAEAKEADGHLFQALEILRPLLFAHKKDFGELQLIIMKIGKARQALNKDS